jgi:hypothetical protein
VPMTSPLITLRSLTKFLPISRSLINSTSM